MSRDRFSELSTSTKGRDALQECPRKGTGRPVLFAGNHINVGVVIKVSKVLFFYKKKKQKFCLHGPSCIRRAREISRHVTSNNIILRTLPRLGYWLSMNLLTKYYFASFDDPIA